MARNQVICENVGTLINNFNTTAEIPTSTLSQKRFPFSFGVQNVVSSFRGREEEVEELDRLFDTSKIVAVHGLGGYGKTQLACHYAELKREKYCGNIVWIKGETESSLRGSFRDVALKLKISNCEKLEISHVIQDVYNYFEATRAFFIIDNAQDCLSILDFLPESFTMKNTEVNVLITSQSTKWGNTIPGLDLQGLSLDYALKVLSTIIGEDKFSNIPQDEWEQLAQTFYCIPLGLQIAGGYVRQRLSSSLSDDFSIKRYITRIEERNMLLDETLAVDSCSSYKKTIYRSLYITVEKMENTNGEESKWALDIINVCAHLHPDGISDILLLKLRSTGGSMDRLEEAISVLEHHSLIIEKKKIGFNVTIIRVHRLVQIFFRYYQGKNRTVAKFYKEAFYSVATDSRQFAQCVHILANTNNLKMLLNSLKGREKKMVIKDWKLLHVASRVVLPEVMQLLLQHGADVNSFYKKSEDTPLCFLIDDYIGILDEIERRKWEDAVRLLLKYKANISVRYSRDGRTVLHAAADWKCASLIGHILDKKQLDVNVKDKWNRTPLHSVTQGKILVEAEMNKAMGCIQVLVSRNADINARDSEGRSLLHYTVMCGNWPLTEFLIDQFGMDSNMRDLSGNTPLHFICDINGLYTEHEIDSVKKTFEILVKRGALMNAQNKKGVGILHLVAARRYLPLIEYLVDICSLNVNIQDCDECTPLHYLAKSRIYNEEEMEECRKVAQALVQLDANINTTDSGGVSILSMASLACNTLLITYLVEEQQADINQQDNEGRTPLFWAVQRLIVHDSIEKLMEATIKLLISKNANPAIKDNESCTILHHCALKLIPQLLEFFIDQHGFNPNEQDANGFTALHYIAKSHINFREDDAISCINLLRNRGAVVDLVNNENLTPAQLAVRCGKSHLIPLIQ